MYKNGLELGLNTPEVVFHKEQNKDIFQFIPKFLKHEIEANTPKWYKKKKDPALTLTRHETIKTFILLHLFLELENEKKILGVQKEENNVLSGASLKVDQAQYNLNIAISAKPPYNLKNVYELCNQYISARESYMMQRAHYNSGATISLEKFAADAVIVEKAISLKSSVDTWTNRVSFLGPVVSTFLGGLIGGKKESDQATEAVRQLALEQGDVFVKTHSQALQTLGSSTLVDTQEYKNQESKKEEPQIDSLEVIQENINKIKQDIDKAKEQGKNKGTAEIDNPDLIILERKLIDLEYEYYNRVPPSPEEDPELPPPPAPKSEEPKSPPAPTRVAPTRAGLPPPPPPPESEAKPAIINSNILQLSKKQLELEARKEPRIGGSKKNLIDPR